MHALAHTDNVMYPEGATEPGGLFDAVVAVWDDYRAASEVEARCLCYLP